jgi:Uma2 family endonuclease
MNDHRLSDELLDGETVLATDISFDEFLTQFDGQFAEWVFGVVIAMSPISKIHDALTRFLEAIFDTYLNLTGGGQVLQAPMVMKPGDNFPGREPDLQVLLPDRLHLLEDNKVAGAANLVVEVVSPESSSRDRGRKFEEYERAGVPEYWILDPIRKEALFYCLGDGGLYQRCAGESEGLYRSQVLERLTLRVDLLWQYPLPSIREAVHMVEAMLKDA